MKFLFVANTNADPSQGASGCDLNMMEALRELGHEVDAVWTGGWPRRVAHHNLHQLLELPRWFRQVVLERCAAQNYDVVQVNQPHAYLAAKAMRRAGSSAVFINRSHGWEPCAWAAMRKYKQDSRPLVRRMATAMLRPALARHNHLVARYSDGVVVETAGDRDAVLRENGCQNVLVLPAGVAEEFLQTPPSLDPARFRRVLHAASFSPHKAPGIVAAIIRRLARESDLELTWLTEESAHPAVRDLLGAEASRVQLKGWLPLDQFQSQLDAHGHFLQPSYFEGFSLAFVQAMARGGIVFGSEIDCMLQCIRTGESGFLFPPETVDPMVDCLLQLAADTDRCLQISQRARVVSAGMTWQRAALDFQEFCQKLIRLKNGGV